MTSSLTPVDPDFWNKAGVKYFRQGNFEAALGCFQKALALNPKHPKANFNLSLTYLKLHRFSKAIEAGQKAVEGPSDDAEAWKILGAAYAEIAPHRRQFSASRKQKDTTPMTPRSWPTTRGLL